MILEKKEGDGTNAVGSVSPFPTLQALPEKEATVIRPVGPLKKIAAGLRLFADGLEEMEALGVNITGVAQAQRQLEESVTAVRRLCPMDEKTKVRVMRMIEKGLRRYEKLYRNSGHEVTSITEYRAFRDKIVNEALKTYQRGMDYFGFILGNDVFGTGKGTSPMGVLNEFKQKVKLVELDWKATLTEALESCDEPVEQSYGFWTTESVEPDDLLAEVSVSEIIERGIVTQGYAEHMLYVLDHCTRTAFRKPGETGESRVLDYPNSSYWTLCPIPPPKMKKLLGGEFAVKFRTTSGEGGNKVEAQLTFADVAYNDHSHRRMIRVDLPAK